VVVALAAIAAIGASDALAVDATTTNVTPSLTTSVWGQQVTFTAKVIDTTVGTTIPTGTVEFSEGATVFGAPQTIDPVTGEATLAAAPTAIGSNTILAVYTPSDGLFSGSDGRTDVSVAKADTTTVGSVTPDPTVAGQVASFTATVAAAPSGAGTPTGSVQFADQFGIFDTVGLDGSGHASTLAASFSGLYADSFSYAGDGHFNPSSTVVSQHVNRATTKTSLSLSPNPVAPGGSLTFQAMVGVVAPGRVDTFGSLQVTVGGVPLFAPIPLLGNAGFTGTIQAPTLPTTYHVVLTYSGDDNTEPSSTAVDVTVAAPTSTVTAAPSTQPSTLTSAPSTQPSAPTNVTASRLNAMTAPLAAALRTRGFAALTKTAETLTAPMPGLLEQKIYSPSAPKSASAAAARKPVLIASGSVRFTKAGRATLRLRLTSVGRKAIRHAKALKLAIVTRFTPRTGSAVVTTQRLTAKAKVKRASSARAATASDWGVFSLNGVQVRTR
jgi:hypothetical protein